MFDHLGLHVKDLAKSTRFYEAALAPLGYVVGTRDATSVSFGPPGAATLYLYRHKGPTGPGVHVALAANNPSKRQRAAVDAGRSPVRRAQSYSRNFAWIRRVP